MQKVAQLLHNTVALTLLIAIIATAAITTLSLSPIAVDNQGQAAGLTTSSFNPQLLSNYLPLGFKDLVQPQANYVSQLSQQGERKFEYNVQLGKQEVGEINYESLAVTNSNSVPVTLQVQANVPQELTNSLNVNVGTKTQSWRVHTVMTNDHRVAQITIDPQTTLNLSLKYEYTQAVNFTSGISLSIEY